ncbi:response regulator transcription factor [Kiloniella litopenaei]|uniref:response regulator transcription factor n=1 Tax=Kiloniella litopenaei TaxID=1549748 RepID=UPI003BACF3B6
MKVLLVEDDPQLGATLERALHHDGSVCEWVKSAEDASLALDVSVFDLIILDWMLPDQQGIDFLKEARNKGITLPVLMLTARTATSEKIEGLDGGADDYLTKPFDLDELFARLRSLGRRREVRASSIITVGQLSLCPDRHEVKLGDTEIQLSKTEFIILKKLMENAGRYVSKSQLEEYAYTWDNCVTPNAIEAQISRLRKRLGSDVISTLRGVGYKVESV